MARMCPSVAVHLCSPPQLILQHISKALADTMYCGEHLGEEMGLAWSEEGKEPGCISLFRWTCWRPAESGT